MKTAFIIVVLLACLLLFGALLPYVQNEPVSYEAPTPEVTATSTVETPQSAEMELSESELAEKSFIEAREHFRSLLEAERASNTAHIRALEARNLEIENSLSL